MENTPQTQPTTAAPAAPIDVTRLFNELIATIGETIIASQRTTGVLEPDGVYSTAQAHLGEKLRALLDESLDGAVTEVAELAATVRAADAERLSRPRYANAPAVTAALVLFERREHHGETYEVEAGERKVTLPAEWLSRQSREDLQEWSGSLIAEPWIVGDLGLDRTHDGAVELRIHGHELEAWLEATAP